MEDKKLIGEIERLLSMTITGASYKYDGNNGLIEMVKDEKELSIELGVVTRKIDDLYFNGVIDLRKKSEMISAVKRKYEKLIKVAPKKEKVESQFEKTLESMGYDRTELFKDMFPNGETKASDFTSGVEARESRRASKKDDDFIPLILFDDDTYGESVEKPRGRRGKF